MCVISKTFPWQLFSMSMYFSQIRYFFFTLIEVFLYPSSTVLYANLNKLKTIFPEGFKNPIKKSLWPCRVQSPFTEDWFPVNAV